MNKNIFNSKSWGRFKKLGNFFLFVFIIFFTTLTFARENNSAKFLLKNIGIIGTYPQLNFDSANSTTSTSGITTQQSTTLAPFILQPEEIVNYPADYMPQDSSPPWYERKEGYSIAYITDGLLYLSTPSYFGVARAYYRYWSANNITGWTVSRSKSKSNRHLSSCRSRCSLSRFSNRDV